MRYHKDFAIQSTVRFCQYKTLISSVLYSALLHWNGHYYYSYTHKDSVTKSWILVELNCSVLEKYELNGDENNKEQTGI